MKICPVCKITKSLKEFGKLKKAKSGINYVCRKCVTSRLKEYRKRYRVRSNRNQRLWREKNKERWKVIKRREYQKNKQRYKNTHLKTLYNISILEYEDLLKKQNYACKICKLNESTLSRKLAVDHNHKTGKIRGLLCSNCNSAIGKLQDDSTLIQTAAKYVQFEGEI